MKQTFEKAIQLIEHTHRSFHKIVPCNPCAYLCTSFVMLLMKQAFEDPIQLFECSSIFKKGVLLYSLQANHNAWKLIMKLDPKPFRHII